MDTERKLVASNTSAKCEYVCAAGYVYNALSQSCVVPNYQCTGQTPANSELIPGDDQGLTANTPKKLVTSNTSAKCEYVCADGYTNVGGSCTSMGAGYQCTGITPANSVLVPGDNLGLTANTPKKLVASNTSAKCEYVCADNFKYENGKCVPKQWRCTKFEQTYQNNVGAEDKCNKAPKTFVD